MKTFKHLALTFVLSAGAAHVAAADRVAPIFPEPATLTSGHEYYLYNVDAGKFLTHDAKITAVAETEDKVLITQRENGYTIQFPSSSNYLYRWGADQVTTNNSAYDWTFTMSDDNAYFIQTPEGDSYYDSSTGLGWSGGESTGLLPHVDLTAEGSTWLLIDGEAGGYYCAKLSLYNALQASDAYGYEFGKFEEIYSDVGSTTEELADAAATLTSGLELTNAAEPPAWSDYPIFFENDLDHPWEAYNSVNGPCFYGGRKLTATVVIDGEATLSYQPGSLDNLTVTIDGKQVRRLWRSEQTNEAKYFEKLTPGTHVIEWETTTAKAYLYNIGIERTPTISVDLLEPGSLGTEVLYNVNSLNDVRRLKIAGPMNDDDWAKLKMMVNLYALDLSEAEITAIPDDQFHRTGNIKESFFHEVQLPEGLQTIGDAAFYNSFLDEVVIPSTVTDIGPNAFRHTYPKEVVVPEGITDLVGSIFRDCYFLQHVTLPKNLQILRDGCFYRTPMTEIEFPETLTTIEQSVFYGVPINPRFPASLRTIGKNAFQGCAIDSLFLPEGITELGAGSFVNSKNLVYVELPSTLHDCGNGDDHFGGTSLNTVVIKSPTMLDTDYESNKSRYFGAAIEGLTLVVPSYLVNTYKLDDYWYNAKEIKGFDTGELDSWTIYKPLVLGARDRFEGTPDMSLRGGGSLKVNGEAAMTFHNLYTETNVNDLDYTTSLLSNCENLSIQGTYRHGYYVQGNTWYFVSLPFDVRVSDIELPAGAQKAVRYYDGAQRAANGAGNSWKNYAEDDVITAGTGFILQTNKGGWLYFPSLEGETKQYVVAYKEFAKALAENPSATAADGGWNLVGNPYQTFYNISHINFTAPITVWNVRARRYDAYSIIDDEFVLTPNQAFFVQCPEEVASIAFPLEGRQTSPEIVSAQAKRKPHMRGLVARRQLIDLTLSAGDASDRTRVVLNEAATEGYDLNADASKFMSLDASVPQLYTLGTDGTAYAINERPEGDGRVSLGLYLPADGAYTLALTRQEGAKVYLFDRETGAETDLTAGEYNFTARAGQTDKRFELRLEGGETTGIGSAGSADGTFAVTVTADGLLLTGVTGAVKVYTTDGRLAGEALAEGGSCRVALPAGLYLVKAGGQTVKVRVD